MTGQQIGESVFIDFANIDFKCPHCEMQYSDTNDMYLNRCNRNHDFTTKIRCTCGKTFGMTYDMFGDATSFKLKTNNKKL